MMAGLNHLRKHTRDPPSGQAAVQGLSVGRPPLQGSVGSRAAAPLFESPVYSLRNVMRVLQTAPRVRHLETDKRHVYGTRHLLHVDGSPLEFRTGFFEFDTNRLQWR
jgi:hypothetical protein